MLKLEYIFFFPFSLFAIYSPSLMLYLGIPYCWLKSRFAPLLPDPAKFQLEVSKPSILAHLNISLHHHPPSTIQVNTKTGTGERPSQHRI